MKESEVVVLHKYARYWLVSYRSQEGIKCLKCGRTSFNQNDVKHRYCGYCSRFHEDPQE